MKSFKLFWKAVKSTRHEMWVSLQVLVATTLVLSLLLFISEHNSQPDVFGTYWDALLWSFMGYIGDPGGFAAYAPITFWGRILKIACALVNIAIFAVPAGLVAGGFSGAIADDKRDRALEIMRARLYKAFRRKQDKKTKLRAVPRYVSMVDVQVMQQIDTKDIIDAVRSSDSFRLRNLAYAVPQSKNPVDRLVIEAIPQQGRTSYGCCIDRGSKVTIIAPSLPREVAMGNFAYYLALYGGFNYVSKEYESDSDEPESFYLVNDESSSAEMAEYMSDLRRLTAGTDRWAMALIVSDSVHPEGLHFVTAKQKKLGGGFTVINMEAFDSLYNDVSEKMNQEFGIESERDVRYLPVGAKNVTTRIGGGERCNAFTLRLDWAIAAFDTRNIAIAYTLAEEIARTLEGREISPLPEWKESGIGYNS